MGQRVELPDGLTISMGGNAKKKGFIRRFVSFVLSAVIIFFVIIVVLFAFLSTPIGINILDALIVALG